MGARSEDRFWTRARARRWLVALFSAALVAIVITAVRDRERSSAVLRGDYPAFYAAGTIALSGRSGRLSDPGRQRIIENEAWPSLGGRFYAFAYPPYVAVFLAPFALLPPVASKLAFTALMCAALYAAVLVLVRLLPAFRAERFPLFVGVLTFAPVFSGVMAGQNISLTMLCYSAMMLLLRRGKPSSQFLGGVVLGLWLFKPHYALVAIVLLGLGGAHVAVCGAALVALLYAVLSFAWFGARAQLEWLRATAWFSVEDFAANAHQMVSILGVTEALHALYDSAALGVALKLFGLVLSLAVLVLVARLFFAIRLKRGDERERCLERLLWLLGPTAVLIAPHALYYDLGLSLLPVLRYVDLSSDANVNKLLALGVLVFVCSILREELPIQPLFLFSAATFFLAYRKAQELCRP